MSGNEKSDQDRRPDDHAVICDLESENVNVLSHMIQCNTQIREADVIMHIHTPPSIQPHGLNWFYTLNLNSMISPSWTT